MQGLHFGYIAQWHWPQLRAAVARAGMGLRSEPLVCSQMRNMSVN